MKTKYLEELRKLLDNYQMGTTEKEEIINDYNEMYDNWIDYGMDEEEVEKKLGEPSSIIDELTEGYKTTQSVNKSKKNSKNGKYIAITPFVSLIIFFIIGFGFDGWTYSWMVFLLIPTTAIALEMDQDPHKFTALMPFISLVIFFILGFGYDLWHPGWIVFLAIPVVAIITEKKSIGPLNTLVALSPIIIVAVYLYLGFEQNLWIEAWPMFLLIPAIAVLNEKKLFKILYWELLIFGGIAGYYYIGYTYLEWGYALLSFVPLVIFAIFQDGNQVFKMQREYRFLVIGSIVLYVLLGYLTKDWGYYWLVFLSIPMFAIIRESKGNEKTIALMPFIATIIFFTLGHFFGLWAYAWLAYLLIPMVAIIKEA